MKIVLNQLLKTRVIFSASISAALVVLPIWAAGLSVAKTIIYLVISSLVMITVRLSWSKPALRTIALGFGLAVALSIVLNESESIVTFGIRAFFSSLIFLSLLIYGKPLIFRVAVVNFSILLVLAVFVEISFRFVVQSQASSQYEVIELF
jgi:hypothetical protein